MLSKDHENEILLLLESKAGASILKESQDHLSKRRSVQKSQPVVE
jgi:hypothetical protein